MSFAMSDPSRHPVGEYGGIETIIREKEVFVFDWDGTILDSMATKSGNFREAFCSRFPDGQTQHLAGQVTGHYLRLSGHPRKHIFLQIMAILARKVEPDSFLRFNDAFEKLNKASLIHARIFPDALALLEELIRRGHRIFISSSVPPQELSDLVEATLPAPIRAGITSILGSSDGHTKGQGHLRTIMHHTGVSKDKLLVFGDDPADHQLSAEAGVDCILVDRAGISNGQAIMTVGSLVQIRDKLPK